MVLVVDDNDDMLSLVASGWWGGWSGICGEYWSKKYIETCRAVLKLNRTA